MKYFLITRSGVVMTFYVRECAECYQMAYGGTISDLVMVEEEVCVLQENR